MVATESNRKYPVMDVLPYHFGDAFTYGRDQFGPLEYSLWRIVLHGDVFELMVSIPLYFPP